MSKEVKKWVGIGAGLLFIILGAVFGTDMKSVVCGGGEVPAVEAPSK
jgi:hypothetical protein